MYQVVVLEVLNESACLIFKVICLQSTEIGKAVNGLTKHGSDKDELGN